MSEWFAALKAAKKSSICDGNLKKVRYEFSDGKEMVEEYNTDTNVVTRRAWKCNTKLGGDGKWDIELGDPEPEYANEVLMIRESISQPIISRRNTKKILEWRIRNLPYPVETYSVTADAENKCIVVRTTNKKYYKKLTVPELERLKLLPEQGNISFSHKFNTLIISYTKPKELLDFENAVLEEVKQIPVKNQGDMNCKPS